MADSAELYTILSCTTALETALRGVDSDLVHFLRDEGFISDDVLDHILNPGAILDEGEDLVMWIRSRVEQEPESYHVLVNYFILQGEPYQPIMRTLAEEYRNQRAAARSQSKLLYCIR